MAQVPHAERVGKICPLHKQDMADVCHACPWWTQLRGAHPQTGKEIDEWACAITFLPILMIETAREARDGAAATRSFRDELVKAANVGRADRAARELDAATASLSGLIGRKPS